MTGVLVLVALMADMKKVFRRIDIAPFAVFNMMKLGR